MCLATAYWAGLDGIVFGANVGDSKKYGGFDDAFIYEQFSKPPGRMLHPPDPAPARRGCQGVAGNTPRSPDNVPY